MDIVNLTGMALIPTVVMVKNGKRAVVNIDEQAWWLREGWTRHGDGPTPTESQVDTTPANLMTMNDNGKNVLITDENGNTENTENNDEEG